jgi:protein-tyrosine phosphatase
MYSQWDDICSISEIIPKKIYLSGLYPIHNNPEKLKQLGITHILGLTELYISYGNDYIIKRINIEDNENVDILKYQQEIIDFMDGALKTNGIVLVHCMMGISRSPTAVIMYIMYTCKFHYITAYNLVKKKRFIINPNIGFVKQLLVYENHLQRSNGALLCNKASTSDIYRL